MTVVRRYTTPSAEAIAKGSVSCISAHHTRGCMAGRTSPSRETVTINTTAASPAGIVVAISGTSPAPAAIRTTINPTCTPWRNSSASATDPCRSSACSGTPSASAQTSINSPPQATATAAMRIAS